MVQPPASLIPGGMVFGVMNGAKRHGELIAHLHVVERGENFYLYGNLPYTIHKGEGKTSHAS